MHGHNQDVPCLGGPVRDKQIGQPDGSLMIEECKEEFASREI